MIEPERLARVREATANLARIQKALTALTQQIQTSMDVRMADDWEDRYLAEGTADIERCANGR